MSRVTYAVLILCIIVGSACANAFNGSRDPKHVRKVAHALTSMQSRPQTTRSPLKDACWDCEVLGNEIVNYYLNAILDGIVVPTCDNACVNASVPFGMEECLLVCLMIGFTVEISLFDMVPIDYIYPCQLAGKCMISDCPTKESCASIVSMQANPAHGSGHQTVAITGTWNMTHLVGAGMVQFMTHATSGTQGSIGPDPYYIDYYAPGLHSATHHIKSSDIEPGDYMTFFYVCQGACGQKFPHSRTLAVGTVAWSYSASAAPHLVPK